MNLLLIRLFKLSILFTLFVIIFHITVAISTNFFPYLESVTFGCTDIKGGSYERTKEFQDWIKTPSSKAKGVILGPSTAYRNIDPQVLESTTGVDWFNFGSSTQTPNVSLTLLKHILEHDKKYNSNIKFVLVDLFKPFINRRGDESCYDLIINSTLSAKEKFDLFYQAPTFKLFDQLVYRSVKNVLPHKIYRNEPMRDEVYAGKGFVCSSIAEKKIHYSNFDSTPQTIEMTSYLEEIISLCHQHEIKVIINLCPVLNKKTYNLLNQEFVITNDEFNKESELFYDSHHMHCDGALVYSKSLADKIDSIQSMKP